MPSTLDGCFPRNKPLLLPTIRVASTMALATRLFSRATAPSLLPALPSPSMSTQKRQWTSSVSFLLPPRRQLMPLQRHTERRWLSSESWVAANVAGAVAVTAKEIDAYAKANPELFAANVMATSHPIAANATAISHPVTANAMAIHELFAANATTISHPTVAVSKKNNIPPPPMVHVMITTMRQGGLCQR